MTSLKKLFLHSTLDQLFIDYLRQSYGDTRTGIGSARSKAEHTSCSLDLARNIAADPGDELEDRGCAFLFKGKQRDLYEACFLEERTEATMGEYYGVTESRICQMLKPIKQEIESYYILRKFLERLNDDESLELQIDWIQL
jgi:DNA-directed RNA polymerase specialized sigma subunit